MHEPRRSCAVRAGSGGASELWAAAVPCGPWGAAFSARMQTFACGAPCVGARCDRGGGGVVATALHLGPVRLEIVGHVLTVHAGGSSRTLKSTLQGKYHAGNGTTVEHGCPGQGGGAPGKEDADAYGCWTVEHTSGLAFSTIARARTDTRSNFSVALGAPCWQGALRCEVAPPAHAALGEGLHGERAGRQGLARPAHARRGHGRVPVRPARAGRREQPVRRLVM